MPILFNVNIKGSPSVGAENWIDLGAIPNGSRIWIGVAAYTSIDKAFTFSLRTNTTGKSTGTLADTTQLDTVAPRIGSTVNHDLYRKGRLHIVTTVSTGTERWWLRITSKNATLGNCIYSITYTVE